MKKCRKCEDNGIVFDRSAGIDGELKICDHIEKACTCGGVPPYQVFTEKGEHAWCVCRTPRIRLIATKKAFRDSGIPQKYRWKFREDFEKVSDQANMLLGFVSGIRGKSLNQPWKEGFYFWGTAGTGKTLLACIILQELMLKYGVPGSFVDLSRQFFQRLKSSYSITDESYGDAGRILDELITVPFLVIDDFGVQRNTDWEMEMLYNLIDSRYAEERPTIITANISLDNFRNNPDDPNRSRSIAHDRIASRIKEMCKVIYFDLPDYREKFAKTNII